VCVGGGGGVGGGVEGCVGVGVCVCVCVCVVEDVGCKPMSLTPTPLTSGQIKTESFFHFASPLPSLKLPCCANHTR